MTATVPQATGNRNNNSSDSIVKAYPSNITSGNTIVIEIGFYWNDGITGVDALTVSDISKTAGTATLGSFAVAKSDVYDFGTGDHLQSIIYYASVTGTGSCTITVSGGASGTYWLMGLNELHSDLGAFTLHDSQLGHNSTGAPTTTDASSTAGAVFIGMLSVVSSGIVTITPDALFTETYEYEDGSADFTGSAIYRIVSGSTTDAASWTAPNDTGWVAVVAVFQEPSGGTTYTQTNTGSVTPSGTVAKSISKTLIGTLTPVGNLIKQLFKTIIGALTPSGSLVNIKNPSGQTFEESMSGTVTPSGDLTLIKFPSAVVPSGVICLWPSTNGSIPTGWTRATALDALYPKGTADATNPGGTGGANTHGHTTPNHNHSADHVHTVPDSGNGSGSTARDAGTVRPPATHTHVSNPNTSNPTSSLLANDTPATNEPNSEPPYFTVVHIQSNGSPAGLPNNSIGLWNNPAGAPSNWNLADGGSGRPDMRGKYLKGAAAAGDGGGTGGNLTHSHTINSHTHGTNFSHAHPNVTSSQTAASMVGGPISGSNAATATQTHTHSLTINTQATDAITGTGDSTGTGSNEPPYTIQAYIQNNTGSESLPTGIICMWTGLLSAIPSGWNLCDGSNSTPDLRSKFVKGATVLSDIGNTGGSLTHSHTATGHTHAVASHSHTITAGNGAGSNETAGSTACATTTHTHPSWTDTGAASFTSGTGTPTVNDYTNTQPSYYTVAYIQKAAGGGASTAYKTLTGSVSPTGAIGKVIQSLKSGAVTPSGSIIDKIFKTITGILTPVGDLTPTRIPAGGGVTPISMSGSVAPSGALSKITSKLFAGSVTPTGPTWILVAATTLVGAVTPVGNLGRKTIKTIVGSLSPSGIVRKLTSKATFTGAVTFIGNLVNVKAAIRLFTGGVTPSGSVSNRSNKTITGSVTPTGGVSRQSSKTITGGVTPSGIVSKRSNKTITGALTPIGNLAKGIQKAFSGAVALAGNLVNEFIQGVGIKYLNVSGAITPIGSVVKSVSKNLIGSLTPSGVLHRLTSKITFTGGLTPSGALANVKAFVRLFAGSLTPSGSLGRVINKPISGIITPAGALIKKLSRTLSGVLSPSGALTNVKAFMRTFAGSITPTGTLGKQANKIVSGVVTPAGNIVKGISKRISGALAPVGSLVKVVIPALIPIGSAIMSMAVPVMLIVKKFFHISGGKAEISIVGNGRMMRNNIVFGMYTLDGGNMTIVTALNEGESGYVTASFFDSNGSPAIPVSASFWVHDSGGTVMQGVTVINPLDVSVTIEMTPAVNTLLSAVRNVETRVVTVRAVLASGAVVQEEYEYNVRRIHFPI